MNNPLLDWLYIIRLNGGSFVSRNKGWDHIKTDAWFVLVSIPNLIQLFTFSYSNWNTCWARVSPWIVRSTLLLPISRRAGKGKRGHGKYSWGANGRRRSNALWDTSIHILGSLGESFDFDICREYLWDPFERGQGLSPVYSRQIKLGNCVYKNHQWGLFITWTVKRVIFILQARMAFLLYTLYFLCHISWTSNLLQSQKFSLRRTRHCVIVHTCDVKSAFAWIWISVK